MTFRSSSSHRPSSLNGFGALMIIIGAVVFSVITSSWSLMLIVGNIHAWWPFIPPMGFDVAVSITSVLVIFTFTIRFLLSLGD